MTSTTLQIAALLVLAAALPNLGGVAGLGITVPGIGGVSIGGSGTGDPILTSFDGMIPPSALSDFQCEVLRPAHARTNKSCGL